LTISKIYSTSLKRRRRLKTPVKRVLAALGVLFILVFVFSLFKNISNGSDEVIYGNAHIDKFRDLNLVHLRFAKANGISPFHSRKELDLRVDDMVRADKLVKITNSRHYTINHLSHSYPYLVPKAADLLDIIGERFQKKLKEKNKDNYLFKITSLLRTNESQKRLRRSNSNATPSASSHLYGTSFDITYRNLAKKTFFGGKKTVYDGTAIGLLSETLQELQKERKLVVVTERKEACFHITVR
jgi:hypothetical protein